MTPARLIELATRHQVHLERLKAGLARDFVESLSKADSLIVRTLTALEVTTLSELTRRDLEATLTALTGSQGEIFNAALDEFLPKLESLADYEVAFERKSLGDVLTATGRKRVKVPPAKRAFKEALTRPIQATGEKLEPFVDNWSQRAVARVNNAIRTGYQQGKTVQQIVQQVKGTRARNFKDALVETTRREATSVVHTAVQHTANTARTVTWEANSDLVTGYEWVSTLDSKTTTQCRSLDGQIFKLGKGPTPPIHIRCRSTTAAQLNKEFDFLNEGATRSSTDGYVNAELSYYDWLKQQPVRFQDSVLGPTRGKLFRDGGISAKRFSELQLDKNFEPLTLEEMRSLEPHAFERAGI